MKEDRLLYGDLVRLIVEFQNLRGRNIQFNSFLLEMGNWSSKPGFNPESNDQFSKIVNNCKKPVNAYYKYNDQIIQHLCSILDSDISVFPTETAQRNQLMKVIIERLCRNENKQSAKYGLIEAYYTKQDFEGFMTAVFELAHFNSVIYFNNKLKPGKKRDIDIDSLPQGGLEDIPANELAEAPEDMPANELAKAPEDMPANELAKAPEDMPANEPAKAPEDMPANELVKAPEDMPANELAKAPEDMTANELAKAPEDMPANEPVKAPEDMLSNELAKISEDIPANETVNGAVDTCGQQLQTSQDMLLTSFMNTRRTALRLVCLVVLVLAGTFLFYLIDSYKSYVLPANDQFKAGFTVNKPSLKSQGSEHEKKTELTAGALASAGSAKNGQQEKHNDNKNMNQNVNQNMNQNDNSTGSEKSMNEPVRASSSVEESAGNSNSSEVSRKPAGKKSVTGKNGESSKDSPPSITINGNGVFTIGDNNVVNVR